MDNTEIYNKLVAIADGFVGTKIATEMTLSSMDDVRECHIQELILKLRKYFSEKVDFVDMEKVKIHAIFTEIGTIKKADFGNGIFGANTLITGKVSACRITHKIDAVDKKQLEKIYKERILLKQLIALDRERYGNLEIRSQEIKVMVNASYTALAPLPAPVLFSLYNAEIAQNITTNGIELIHELIKDTNNG